MISAGRTSCGTRSNIPIMSSVFDIRFAFPAGKRLPAGIRQLVKGAGEQSHSKPHRCATLSAGSLAQVPDHEPGIAKARH